MSSTQYSHVLKIYEYTDDGREEKYNDLHVTQCTIEQELSTCYRITLDVTTRWMQVPTALIGRRASFTWKRSAASQTMRGVVDSVELISAEQGVLLLRITIVPRLLMAAKDRRDRVFNDLDAGAIIDSVLSDVFGRYGDAYEMRGDFEFVKREICIQYQQSSLDFLLRIFAEEGLHFHFDHQNEREVLIIASSNHVFEPALDVSLLYRPQASTDDSCVSQLQAKTQSQAAIAQVSCTDWSDDPANARLQAYGLQNATSAHADFAYITHHVCYAPGYSAEIVGQHARLNHEMRAVTGEGVISGETNCLTLAAGTYFTLAQHPDISLEQVYLVTQCSHIGRTVDASGGHTQSSGQDPYRNTFRAILFHRPYRTACPEQSPVTALHIGTVITPPGEDIDTDAFGRINVLFQWDQASRDANRASGWLRYNQVFAGNNHGLMAIPRANTEVLIGFINGHIDHPVVIGSVYNGGQQQPYHPQVHKSRTTLRTYTTPRGERGDVYNELTFEDTQHQQCIALHAAKDYATRVKGRHIDVLADNMAFKPFASRKNALSKLPKSVDDLIPDVFLNPAHDRLQDNSFEAGLEDMQDAVAHGVHSAAKHFGGSVPAHKQPDAKLGVVDLYQQVAKMMQVEVPALSEGRDPLLLTENLQHVLMKLALQTAANHVRDQTTETAFSRVKQHAAKRALKKTPGGTAQPAAPIAPIVKLKSLFQGSFDYPAKFEEDTRTLFEKHVDTRSAQKGPSVWHLILKWFPSLVLPGASALWKRLSFTDGGVMDATTKDRRTITFKKRIAHVGGESSDSVYGNRFQQTSGAADDIVLGVAQQRFGKSLTQKIGGDWSTDVHGEVAHKGDGKWTTHHRADVSHKGDANLTSHHQGTVVHKTDANFHASAAKKFAINSGEDLVLQSGASGIVKAAHHVQVEAKNNLHLQADDAVTIVQGTTKIHIKAGKVTIEATDVVFDVANFELNAKNKVRIKGAKIDIG